MRSAVRIRIRVSLRWLTDCRATTLALDVARNPLDDVDRSPRHMWCTCWDSFPTLTVLRARGRHRAAYNAAYGRIHFGGHCGPTECYARRPAHVAEEL